MLVWELTSVLRALDLLLEGDPRLLGLLAVPAALAPIAACLQPAAELTGEGGRGGGGEGNAFWRRGGGGSGRVCVRVWCAIRGSIRGVSGVGDEGVSRGE